MLDQQTAKELLNRLAADEGRIKELEDKLSQKKEVAPQAQTHAEPTARVAESATVPVAGETDPADQIATEAMNSEMHGHTMEMPGGGPNLQLRGFLDFDFGVGSDANPLIFPLNATPHSGFQAGEFTLMASSRLSDRLSFMSELVVGSDTSNEFGVDLERFLLSYRASKFFEGGCGAVSHGDRLLQHGLSSWHLVPNGHRSPFHVLL